ncbi:MAG: DUF4340 domain-containing protein [Spirochaetia bacterium]|nr:DUF4340 domain-containing protein [Spirochaetia bacterium]
MNYLLSARKIILENTGLSLFGFNLFLLLVIAYLYDPFSLFQKGYEGASSILSVTQENTRQITVQSGDLEYRLIKKNQIEDQFEWDLEYKSGASAITHAADPERIKEFFNSIKEAKRFYSFSRTPENDTEMGFSENAAGKCECMTFTFEDENQDKETIYVGRSTTGGESHVRVNDESEIFLVRTDLKSASGFGETDFFRNRRLMPEKVKSDAITSINAKFTDPRRNVQLSKAGGIWRMVSPAQGTVRIGTLPEDISEMKADQFLDMLPQDINKESAFTLEIVYKKNLTEAETVSFKILGSKDNDIYYLENQEGNLFQIYSFSFKELYNPVETLLEKESILEKTN